ncbi:unnamed protein product [Rotaria magnacalcarata]|uniref:Pentapeptide repeat-containing protein n=8 Tax=Rotaria magnacalcarata TaxID=392030 RepID=A0A815Z038_9BILA|nr:unnamed protein product [Rotaria magnacalcarata]CAF2061172.1 unnamed protein product [Rotaria magnacalcarata]CAF3946762.1 unnamed protein product [Rotaria magnacalcarata]CAF4172720.1 unnamed protein product [Rotaria magnacalcarata]CAF4209633.1 unnamed protein product [Rotaria magnacalcarata]
MVVGLIVAGLLAVILIILVTRLPTNSNSPSQSQTAVAMQIQSNEHIAQLQRDHEQLLLKQQQSTQSNFTLELTKRAENFSGKKREEDRDWNQLNAELSRNITATHHQKEFEFRETVELAAQRAMAQERQQHEWTLEQYRSQQIGEYHRQEQFRQDEHDLDKFLDAYNLTSASIPLLQRKVLSLLRRLGIPHKTLLIQILNDANLLRDNDADLPGRRISLARTNLNGIQLGSKDEIFCPSQYFDQLDLNYATLIGASFDCLSLRNTSFRLANLTYASLTRSDLRDSRFAGAKLHNASFQEAQLDRGDFNLGSLVGANFRQASLINASLSFADATETDFSEAKLDAAVFFDGQLYRANFERANLHKANLESAKLVHTNFYQAKGAENSFQFTNITDAIFRQANVIQSNFYGAEGNRIDFSKAILNGSKFDSVKLEEAIFEDASMTRVSMQMAQLIRSNFRGALLGQSTLSFTTFNESNFSNAILDDSILAAVHLYNTTFENASMNRIELASGKLFNCNFRRASFIEARFAIADLTESDFSESNLNKSIFLLENQLNQVFSISKAILPDGSIGKNKNLIRNGNPACDESMTMNISQWAVPVQGSIIIVPKVNDGNCVFQATTSNITHLIQSVDVSHYVKRMMNADLTYVLLEADIITNNININLRFFNSTDNLIHEGIHNLVVSF